MKSANDLTQDLIAKSLLDALDEIPSLYDISTKGIDLNGSQEGALHEICHAVILGLYSGPLTLFKDVAWEISQMSCKGSDWNEIRTLALEVAFMRKRHLCINANLFLEDVIFSGMWRYFSFEKALILTKRQINTYTTRRLISRVTTEIQRLRKDFQNDGHVPRT